MCMATTHHDATSVTETNWWQVTWESRLPATPPPPRALDDEEFFVVEGSKNPLAETAPQLKVLQNKGFGEIMSRFPRKIVGRSKNCAHFSILREGDRPDTARGAFSPAKPVKNRPLPGSTTSAATSSWQRTQARGRAGRELTSGAEYPFT